MVGRQSQMASRKIVIIISLATVCLTIQVLVSGLFNGLIFNYRSGKCKNLTNFESEYYIVTHDNDYLTETNAILVKRMIDARSVAPQVYLFSLMDGYYERMQQPYLAGGFLIYPEFSYYNLDLCILNLRQAIVIRTSRNLYIPFFLEPGSDVGEALWDESAFDITSISRVLGEMDLSSVTVLKTRTFKGCETAFYIDTPVMALNLKCKYGMLSY